MNKEAKKSVLITLQQASAEYGPPYTSLRDLVIRGHLPQVRLGDGRRIWVRRSDIERLIERSTVVAEGGSADDVTSKVFCALDAGPLPIYEVVRLAGVSQSDALCALKNLMGAGLVVATGAASGTLYKRTQ